MLQNIRNNVQGPTTKIVVWLIVISFSIFGLESILVGGGSGGIAEVNGEQVTPQEMQMAVNTQKRRLISMMGDNLDPAMLDDELISGQVLNSLIGRKLLAQSAQDMNLAVSKREVGSLIGGMEQFQIDGKFSPQLFSSVLSGAGYTPSYFEQTLREDVVVAQLRSGIAGSEFATPLELALSARVAAEQRDLRYLTIPLQTYIDGQEVGEQEIADYYAEHQNEFQTRETVELDYIELGLDQFRKPVDEATLLEAYQVEVDNGQYQTENRVSHIMFEARDGEDESALQQRIAQAQAQLASGADFAEVAGEFSDDIGSVAMGGDLGFSSGDAFPPEMEEVIAELPVNTVSEPVETDAGIHLIMVTDRREGAAPSLEEMRPQLEEQLQTAQARVDLLLAVEQLKDMVFNAEDLNQPAAAMDLNVERSEPIARDQTEGLFANRSLLSAAFSEEVMEAGHNSDVIELGDNRFVVLRQHIYNPSKPMALDVVRDEISAIIVEENARAMVAAEAERILQELAAGATIDELASAGGYDWQVELAADRRNSAVPADVLARAFEMPAPEQGETLLDYVVTAQGDAQVLTLMQVNPGSLAQLEQGAVVSLQQQVTGEYANLLDNEYQKGLRERADISVM